MIAGWTDPARVLRRHGDQQIPIPGQLVVELAVEFEPVLVEDGLVQSRLGPNALARLLGAAGSRLRYVFDLQILDADHRVVLADGVRGLVQVVLSDVADAGVETLDSGLGFLPVLAETRTVDQRR
jgi:hypothetical protein